MLTILLKILYIIGIIFLIILGILLTMILLVLFLPIFYKMEGKKDAGSAEAKIKASWMFGLLRVFYKYPEPGNIIVKVLFFKVFDSSKSTKSDKETDNLALSDEAEDKASDKTKDKSKDKSKDKIEDCTETRPQDRVIADNISDQNPNDTAIPKTFFETITEKIDKIKYTIRNIYDKILNITENIEFYKGLLEEDNTKELIKHIFKRLRKILKNIRPRKLKANIVFGAATPDVTGYVYGIYGMLSPSLGKKFYLEPDFTQNILEGNIYASGYITVFIILINAAAIIFDKKLRILKRKLEKNKNKHNKVRNGVKNGR